MSKKPADLERERINRRTRKTLILAGKNIGRLTESEKKTPSQRKSELGRKKLNRGIIKKEEPVPFDCSQCPDHVGCTKPSLDVCHRPSAVHKCLGCGIRVRHPIIPGMSWEYCPVCRERKR